MPPSLRARIESAPDGPTLAAIVADSSLAAVLDEPLRMWLAAGDFMRSPHQRRLVEALTPGITLGAALRLDLGRKGSKAWVLDLGTTLLVGTRLVLAERLEPDPVSLPLPTTPDALHAWAAQKGVLDALRWSAAGLAHRYFGRADGWLEANYGATVAAALKGPPGKSRWDGAPPLKVQHALVAALETLGATRAPVPPPTERPAPAPGFEVPCVYLDAFLDVGAAGVNPSAASPSIQWRLQEDPPALTCDADPRSGCGTWDARVTLLLRANTAPACRCANSHPTIPCQRRVDAALAARRALSVDGDAGLQAKARAALATPDWERALRDLDRELATAGVVDAEPEPPLPVGWAVDVERGALALVVTTPKKGGGLKFARATRDQGRACLARPMLPADRAALELLGSSHAMDAYGPVVGRAFRRLVGHPRLFDNTTRRRVALRLVPLVIELREVDDGGIELAPTLDGGPVPPELLGKSRDIGDGHCLIALPEDELALVPLPGPARRLMDLLVLRGSRFPAEALPGLLQRLPAIARVVQVATGGVSAVREVPADGRLHAQLEALPDGGVQLRVRVRPLGDGPFMVPGRGDREIFGADGGRPVAARRDLAAEHAALAELARHLELAPADDEDPGLWFVEDPDQALAVVEALQGTAEVVAWIGPPLRVTRPATTRDLIVKVGAQANWFGLNGTLTVDDAVVPLADLLAAVRLGKRFVRVDEGRWMRLEDQLRRRIATLATVAQGKTLTVGPMHTPLLTGLAEEGAEVGGVRAWQEAARRLAEAERLDPALPPTLDAHLRPYQREGARWILRLAHWAGGAVLADDMGLGKTLQALVVLAARAPLGPALVVAPTSVGFNWVREATRFAPELRVTMHRGTDRDRDLARFGPGDVLVTSYDILVRDLAHLDRTFATFVLDEAHAVKNATTQRFQAAQAVKADFRLALSGTPVENRLAELWALFRVVVPGMLGSAEAFRERFVLPIERDGDAGRREALARLVRPFLLRRRKSEVATDLPAREEVRVDVVMGAEERAIYERVRLSTVAALTGVVESGDPQKRRFEVLAALTRLRQLACHPRLVDPASSVPSAKLARLVELVAELKQEGRRALVFSQFTEHLSLARDALVLAGFSHTWLDGSTPEAGRRAAVDSFQSGAVDLFLLSLKAGGTGLNLTAASDVLLLDPWWNPAVEDQAADRAHRIGQTRAVTIWRLVSVGTVEEQILQLHARKRDLVAGVLDGTGQAGALSVAELVALMGEVG